LIRFHNVVSESETDGLYDGQEMVYKIKNTVIVK